MVLFHEELKVNSSPADRFEWLEAAMDALPLMVIAVDGGGTIQFANHRAAQQLELDSKALHGQSIHKLLGRLAQDEAVDLPMDEVLKEGRNLEFVAVPLLPTLAQGLRWQATVRPLLDGDCEIMGALLSLDLRPTPNGDADSTHATGGSRPALFVRSNGRYTRVLLEELLWVEAMENYVQLQTTRERLVVHATLKGYEEALAGKGFQRIHRSFIVKRDEIERIEENHVVVAGTVLPIGKSFRSELLDSLTLI
jgi:PAS domain-containing protein